MLAESARNDTKGVGFDIKASFARYEADIKDARFDAKTSIKRCEFGT